MSILADVKKLLGIPSDVEYFDPDILIHINTTFSILHQLGVGPEEGFFVEDDSKDWIEFTGGRLNLNDVKTYVYLKVKLLFDPPASSSVAESFTKQIQELEWRMNVATSE